MNLKKLYLWLVLLCGILLIIKTTDARSISGIRSDVIQTKFGPDPDGDPNKPGWMRRQLMRFGEMASRVGNTMGAHATTVTNAIDKVCEVVKTVIPLLAAVCHVGQFKFCAATEEAPAKLTSALAPSVDLNIPD